MQQSHHGLYCFCLAERKIQSLTLPTTQDICKSDVFHVKKHAVSGNVLLRISVKSGITVIAYLRLYFSFLFSCYLKKHLLQGLCTVSKCI